MIKFAYTILYVKDVTKTVKFYEKAFGFKKKFIAENQYGELLCGDTTLSFASHKLAKSNLPKGFEKSSKSKKPFGIEIGFTTADVQKTMNKAVKAGATLLAAPKAKPWGQIVGYLRDLDGFIIEICTPMSQ
jgi:lactoylglutathione lyase